MAKVATAPTAQSAGAASYRRSLAPSMLRRLRRYPVLSGTVLLLLLIAGIFGPLIEPQEPNEQSLRARAAPGFWNSAWYDEHPNVEKRYFLGADQFGRDVFSRIIDGARISLLVVSVALAAGLTIGATLGLASGYFGGYVDLVVTLIWNIWAAIPFLLIALVVAAVIGNSVPMLVGLLAMVSWAAFVRNVRAEVFSIKERDYVSQSRVAGAGALRIMWKHILPNVINTIVVIATLRVGALILAEASLSYLGVGIPNPQATWGKMVSDGREYLADAWWISLWPGLAIFLVVMSLNFTGDWLRDKWDPRLRQI
jgi:peptide/nickel transport system permease protein